MKNPVRSHRSTTAVLIIIAAIASLTSVSVAQSAGHRIEELAFITGSWQGPLFGGDADETWMPPRDGTMVGVFRLTWPDNDRKIYELFLAEEVDDRVVMTFRHFSPLMEAWEHEIGKPNMFEMVESGDTYAVFDAPDKTQKPGRLTFRLSDEGQLQILVESFEDDGTISEERFEAVYDRVE